MREQETCDFSGCARHLASDALTRTQYSTAACMYQITPSAVVFPESEAEVAAVVRRAAETGVPVTARGGGSSLVGQALGRGVILDFSRFMRAVLELDEKRRRVRVQPGITLGVLNRHLAARGFMFPPDPSSGDYATIGGMIACNSSGAHSVKYGSTIDYVAAVRCVLADGSVAEFRGSEAVPISPQTSLLAGIVEEIPAILRQHESRIREIFPKCAKNASGYQLARALKPDGVNLASLIVGSEGTLAIVTEAELEIVPRPPASSMVLINFASVEAAGEAVHTILPLGPSAVEIMDQTALDMIRAHRPELATFLPTDAVAQLFVEFDGDNSQTTESACRMAVERSRDLATGHVYAFDAATHSALMNVRKATLPILYTLPGKRRPVAFVEDVVVPPESLGRFIGDLKTIFQSFDVEAAIYGHAGQGNLHVRPLLDLTDARDIARLELLASAVFGTVSRYGGSMSGEHGDGRARAPFLRRMYGELSDVFVDVKELFDPSNILNPGVKVSRAPHALDSDLRLGSGHILQPLDTPLPVSLHEITDIISRCHGCGTCRIPEPPVTMCPVYKALGDEAATPRAKANLLRLFASGQLPDSFSRTKDWKRILDTCIGCRMCSFECPSGVDIGRIMLIVKGQYSEHKGRPIAEIALGASDFLSSAGRLFSPLSNVVARQPFFGAALDMFSGIDRRRRLPRFARKTFSSWHRTYGIGEQPAGAEAVVYFPDQCAQYHDPDVGKALHAVLNRLGIHMIVPETLPCGIAAAANGGLKRVRRLASHNVEALRPYAEAGLRIIATEPTATLFLKDEYRDILGSRAAELVAGCMQDASQYVEQRLRAGNELHLRALDFSVAYHAPCHLKAMRIGLPAVDILKRIPSLRIQILDEGCCGMAGTYGMKRAYFDTSMAIGKSLLNRLSDASIDYGVTDCSTCKLQMEFGTTRTTLHPLKLLAHSMGAEIPLR
ncbi:MAG: Anaerobic glycerol-3-phosphate dehydrogenase subunit C [Candidatus Latescibacteria bacterium ADurb.Bin168]|nr:MAG: Anaerobic glycerol-3-phosphate dehydrogenase subunit C [Candidatus Latescibacteria bacterium ADurb.Bin168]